MSKLEITAGIMIGSMLLWLIWDIIVAVTKPRGDTISEVTLSFWARRPYILFMAGYLCGHLFWPQYLGN